jgi:hypothetical protein
MVCIFCAKNYFSREADKFTEPPKQYKRYVSVRDAGTEQCKSRGTVQCTSCIVMSSGSETRAFGLTDSLTGLSATWWNLHRSAQRRIMSIIGTKERASERTN